MSQRFKVSVELSIDSDFPLDTIKHKFAQGLVDKTFYDLKFESFERISFTKKEAIQEILSLPGVQDNFVDIITEIINRIS